MQNRFVIMLGIKNNNSEKSLTNQKLNILYFFLFLFVLQHIKKIQSIHQCIQLYVIRIRK